MTDGKRRSPPDELADQEMEHAVEEGIDVVSEAVRQLLARPKGEREAHLAALLDQVRSFSSRLQAASEKGEAVTRARALERVIEILQQLATR